MVNGILSHSTLKVYRLRSGTTRYTTRRCFRSSGRSKNGGTTSKAQRLRSRSGRTTRTWSTSSRPRSSTVVKPAGPYTSPASTSLSSTVRVGLWVSRMLSRGARITRMVRTTTRMWFYLSRPTLLSVPRVSLLKGRRRISSRLSGLECEMRSSKMQWQRRQRS